MQKIITLALVAMIFVSCHNIHADIANATSATPKDTASYPYHAKYANLSMSTDPTNAQRVLTVWKMYENKQMDAMKSYYADTVTYDAADGTHYYGPSDGLLNIAKTEMAKLDSLRFDINMWESVHSNDTNEDWVNIWCTERAYPKKGKADTALMYEKWMIRNGKVYAFNQYYERVGKK